MAQGEARLTVMGLVEPSTVGGLEAFMGETEHPTVIDDASPHVLEAYEAQVYELVIVAPDGTLPALRRSWTLPDEHDELVEVILELLGHGTGPPTDVVSPGPDVVDTSDPAPPDSAQTDTGAATDVPVLSDAPAPSDTPAGPDTPVPADAGVDAVADVPASFDLSPIDPGKQLEDFAAEDHNPSSPWFGQEIGPEQLRSYIYLMYFASAG